MKAAVVVRYGGPDVLELMEIPIPRPGPGQLLVRVRGIGLNFADVVGRWGVYPGTPRPPFVPGIEFSGDVVGLGEGVVHFKGGERVMGYSRWGSHAEYVLANEHFAAPIPAEMSYDQGAAFLVTSLTAYHGLVQLARIQREEKVIIHAAGGGVGTAAVQLARHLSAEVFATAGTEDKLEMARKQGAQHLLLYRPGDFAGRIRQITNNHGVDVVMDSVGGSVFTKSWNLLAPMGRYVLYGISAVSGRGRLNPLKVVSTFSSMRPLFVPRLISSNKGIFGFNLGTLVGKEEYFRRATTELLQLQQEGVLKPIVGSVYRFSEIREAHRALQTGKTVGKVVVRVEMER